MVLYKDIKYEVSWSNNIKIFCQMFNFWDIYPPHVTFNFSQGFQQVGKWKLRVVLYIDTNYEACGSTIIQDIDMDHNIQNMTNC